MPNVLLPLPHFEQTRDGLCLPTCVQMVLAYYGDQHTEADLATLLGAKQFGTPISNAERLRAAGYNVVIQQMTQEELETRLTQNQPVIVRIWTAMLDYWNVTTSHVAVAVGFDETNIYLNDPAFANAPTVINWDAFLAAWAEYDETAVIITPTD
jgi:ABC-type bacteriocin/lantibiotic exporter with double-glycine peptidase domain